MLTVIVLKIAKVARLKRPGKIRSTTVTSFENLVYTLPIGFESKNRILDLQIDSTILVCIFVILTIKIIMMTVVLAKVNITYTIMKTPNKVG